MALRAEMIALFLAAVLYGVLHKVISVPRRKALSARLLPPSPYRSRRDIAPPVVSRVVDVVAYSSLVVGSVLFLAGALLCASRLPMLVYLNFSLLFGAPGFLRAFVLLGATAGGLLLLEGVRCFRSWFALCARERAAPGRVRSAAFGLFRGSVGISILSVLFQNAAAPAGFGMFAMNTTAGPWGQMFFALAATAMVVEAALLHWASVEGKESFPSATAA